MATTRLGPRPTKLPIRHPKQFLLHILRSGQSKEFRGGVLPQTDIQGVGIPSLSRSVGGIFGKTGRDRGIVAELR